MPELWERDQLAGSIHSLFRLATGDGRTMDMELVSVSGLLETERQRAFSIIFQGPPDMPLSQGTYRMEHDGMEAIDLFIVPVGRSVKGLEYEAVFNRLR
ncbi:MAG: hypothetical protein HZB62_05180 [Nitrospirae bacterium]|nr:hypothetical protein [Nitrospirota bacterium]